MGVLGGAILGAIIGLVVALMTYYSKEQAFKKISKTIPGPTDYIGLYHYASYKRYKSSFKYFDSYGALYLVGKMLHYKASNAATTLSFDLNECSVQMEPDWRWLKWFSVTTPVGEKFYFNSSKMGAFKNNSDETLKGFEIIKARATS